MARTIRLPPQPQACELCGREAVLTRHHLIPKSLHDKPYVRKRHGRLERITATLWVCRPCHDQIHKVLSEKELALLYNTREALLAHPRIQTFVQWLSRKPAGFVPRH